MHLATERSVSIDEPQSVRQLRRNVQMVFGPAQRSLEKIKAIVDERGKVNVETDLGADSSELDASYNAIKALLLILDPTLEIPDLE